MAHPPRPARDASEGAHPGLGLGRSIEQIGHVPFACQHGHQLLILDGNRLAWTLAELRFDPVTCSYVEIRRTRYRWTREAAGALLARVLVAGRPAAEETAHSLVRWLATVEAGLGT